MLKVYSPHDLHLIREIPFSKTKEIERSLERAEKLFKDKKNHIPAWKRIEVLEKVVEIMEQAVTLEVPNKVDYEHGTNWGTIND